MRRSIVAGLVVMLLIAALGCVRGGAIAIATPGPTASPTLSPTPSPTATASPTLSPTPSPAATASPVPAVTPVPRVRLPEDDASHPVETEWWYFNGHLFADDRTSYSFHYVFFDVVRENLPEELLLGQLAIADHRMGTYSLDMRLDRKTPEPERGFLAISGEWRMSGSDGRFELVGSVDEYSLDLTLSATKPPVLHDGDGVVEFPLAGDSFYYTYPRLEVRGTLEDHGFEKPVTGSGWMDHQWGDFEPVAIGWDWYSLQLEDNTEVMFFMVREHGGPTLYSLGTYVDDAGLPHPLASEDVDIQSLDTWTSPDTDAQYPSGWRFEVGSLGLSLTLTPLVRESEFYVPNFNIPAYWEGAVEVNGEAGGTAISGLGFVELVGYAGTPDYASEP